MKPPTTINEEDLRKQREEELDQNAEEVDNSKRSKPKSDSKLDSAADRLDGAADKLEGAAEDLAGKSFARNDKTRGDIYKRQRKARSGEESEALSGMTPEQQQQLIALREQAGSSDKEGEGDDTSVDDDDGEFDTDAQMVTIKVYGKEESVPLKDILEAGEKSLSGKGVEGSSKERIEEGIRAVQIAKAAERKAKGATKPVATDSRSGPDPAVDELNRRMAQIEASIRAGAGVPSEGGTPSPTSDGSPPPAMGADVDEILKEASDHIYTGKAEEWVKSMKRLLSAQGAATTPTTLNEDALDRAVDRRFEHREQRRQEEERKEATRVFYDEFDDIASVPESMAYTKALIGRLMKDPDHAERSPLEIAREAGRMARQSLGLSEKPSQVDKLAQMLDGRKTVKKKMPRNVTASSARNTPAPKKRRMSNSEWVQQEMRRRQGKT